MNATSKRKRGRPVNPSKGPITNFRLDLPARSAMDAIVKRTGWTKTRAVEQALRFALTQPGFTFQPDN